MSSVKQLDPSFRSSQKEKKKNDSGSERGGTANARSIPALRRDAHYDNGIANDCVTQDVGSQAQIGFPETCWLIFKNKIELTNNHDNPLTLRLRNSNAGHETKYQCIGAVTWLCL